MRTRAGNRALSHFLGTMGKFAPVTPEERDRTVEELV
jgi:hypothetical protein